MPINLESTGETAQRDHRTAGARMRESGRVEQRKLFELIRAMRQVFGRAAVAELESGLESAVGLYDEACLELFQAIDVEQDRLAAMSRHAERLSQELSSERMVLVDALKAERARARKSGRELAPWAQAAERMIEEPF